MRNRVLRLLSLLLVILTVSSIFASCGSSDDDYDAVTGEQSEEDPVPHLDWGGRPFRVLATHNTYEPNFEIVGEAGADKLLNTVYERNLVVQEYCNVEIKDVAGDGVPLDYLEKDYMSGLRAYDLAFLIRDDMSSAIERGYMKDMTKVNYINLENPWYNPLTISSMKISDRLYHMTSDFSLVDKARTNTLFYNRDLASDLQIEEDVIALIREGTWTIDVMYEMATKAAFDVDDNSKADPTDRYGLVCGGSEGAVAFYSGMGNTLVSFDANNNYQIKMTEERSLGCLDYIEKILSVESWLGFTGSEEIHWTKDYNAPGDAFEQGRALFYSSSMSAIDDLAANADFAYTAIVYPKYNTDQEHYYTTNDNTYGSTFGIPYAAADLDFCGYMIEVLSWKSHTTTYPEYYEVKCKVQKSYDPVCAEMLELNINGLVYDFGCQFSGSIRYKRAIEKFIVHNKDNKSIVDYYNEETTGANNAIDGILDKIANLPE